MDGLREVRHPGTIGSIGHQTNQYIDTRQNPLDDPAFRRDCRAQLEKAGALVLAGFFTQDAIQQVIDESSARAGDAYFVDSTHSVYLTAPDPTLPDEHAFNRQVTSSKGLIADDQIPVGSPLRTVYNDKDFRSFLCAVLGIDQIHAYADDRKRRLKPTFSGGDT